MLKWKKTGRIVREDGGVSIMYEAVGKVEKYRVESRKRPIERANGSGSWMYTSYILFVGGQKQKFFQLRAAKRAAEEMEGQAC